MKASHKKLIRIYTPIASVVGISLFGGAVSFEYAQKENMRPPVVVSERSYEDGVDAGLSAFLHERKEYIAMVERENRELVAAAMTEQTEPETIQAEVQAYEEMKKAQEQAADPWNSRALPRVEEYLNIRSEASQESAALGKLPKGAMAEVVEQAGEWTKISSGSVTGYVKTEYLAFGSDAKQLAGETCPLMATVQTNSLRIRKEASESAGVITLAGAGENLKVLEQGAEWLKVEYKEGKEGYIASAYATVDLQVGKAISAEEEAEAARKAAEAKRKAEEAEAAAKAKQTEVETVQGQAMAASTDETTLLAAVIQMEAGGQSYEGKLAVASVVMNRVNCNRYPNNITDVIYQRGQFPGAHNGILNRILAKGPRQDCIQVAQDALAGKNNAGGYLSFCSLSSSAYKKYSSYTRIGAHYFY